MVCVSFLGAKTPALEVATFNLRFANPADGANQWANRRPLVTKMFADEKIDVAGLQEALALQVRDLERALPDYAWIGVGRDDGKNGGEFNPIFYRRDRLEPGASGTFWLSATPEKAGSMGWDAACPRVATWAVFRDRRTGRRIFFLNTHLDHRGPKARREAAKLLVRKIAALSEGRPVVVTGDFNSSADSPELAALFAGGPGALRAGGEVAATFNGFDAQAADHVIDHILVGAGIAVSRYRAPRIMKDGVFVSDHWPVLGDVEISSGLEPRGAGR